MRLTHPVTEKDYRRIKRDDPSSSFSKEDLPNIGICIKRVLNGFYGGFINYCYELDEDMNPIWISLRTLQRRKAAARIMVQNPDGFSMEEMEKAAEVIRQMG